MARGQFRDLVFCSQTALTPRYSSSAPKESRNERYTQKCEPENYAEEKIRSFQGWRHANKSNTRPDIRKGTKTCGQFLERQESLHETNKPVCGKNLVSE